MSLNSRCGLLEGYTKNAFVCIFEPKIWVLACKCIFINLSEMCYLSILLYSEKQLKDIKILLTL